MCRKNITFEAFGETFYQEHTLSVLHLGSEENQKTQPGFKPGFSSVWWVGFLFLNNQ